MERTCRVLDAKVVHRNKRARAYGTSSGGNPGKAVRIFSATRDCLILA